MKRGARLSQGNAALQSTTCQLNAHTTSRRNRLPNSSPQDGAAFADLIHHQHQEKEQRLVHTPRRSPQTRKHESSHNRTHGNTSHTKTPTKGTTCTYLQWAALTCDTIFNFLHGLGLHLLLVKPKSSQCIRNLRIGISHDILGEFGTGGCNLFTHGSHLQRNRISDTE